MANKRPASTVCIALTIGLPGSGKSKLSDFIKHLFTSTERKESKEPKEPEEVTLNVIQIRYDQMITPELKYKTTVDLECGKHSSARLEVMNIIERLVYMLKDSATNEPAHKIVIKAGSDIKFVKKSHEWEVKPLRRTLIIIDDYSMCVSSMRYSYFELARRHSAGFCQFYLDCSQEDALKRCQSRAGDDAIPEEFFQKIAVCLEPPESKPWEKNTLLLPAFEPLSNESTVLAVKGLISRAFLNPEECIDEWDHIDDATRNACIAVIIGHADGILKTFVTQKVKSLKGLDSDEQRIKARVFERRRIEILEGLKTREVAVPKELFLMFQFDHPIANLRLKTFLEGKMYPT